MDFFPTCVLMQLCGIECWKIQNLAGLFLIRILWFGKDTELSMLEKVDHNNKVYFFQLHLASPEHVKISEDWKWKTGGPSSSKSSPCGFGMCGLKAPGSGTQMSNTAGQFWKFSEISGWCSGAWLALERLCSGFSLIQRTVIIASWLPPLAKLQMNWCCIWGPRVWEVCYQQIWEKEKADKFSERFPSLGENWIV